MRIGAPLLKMLILSWLMLGLVRANLSCAVEPFPTPRIDPHRVAISALEDGAVTAFGLAGAAPDDVLVVFANTTADTTVSDRSDDEGRFVLTVLASEGDELRLYTEGGLDAALEAVSAPPEPDLTPNAPGATPGTEPEAMEIGGGIVRVVGPAFCVSGAAVVIVANASQASVMEVTADISGAFSLSLSGSAGDTILLVALVDGRTSASTAVTVTACVDLDGDGYCGVEDCDDLDPTAGNGLEELFDGIDNDCDGLVDEGFASCATGEDCSPGLACVDGLCLDGCGSSDECGTGYACWDGACVPGCGSNEDCLVGQVCVSGVCVAE